MIEVCIYGNEKLDERAIELIEDLERESIDKFLEKMKKFNPKDAAEHFIYLAAKLDYMWTGKDDDYIKNVIALMNESIKPGFYEALIEIRDSFENLPRRINMVVLAQ